ncbi:hypothetical protein [Sphingobium cloacae]|uniref:hypothetical protein n=1 Tax=Sphingobium cloacae TaxID=120107 RepID=UPI000835C10E|nr:hypothetical protein [Sphingobium cloacae]
MPQARSIKEQKAERPSKTHSPNPKVEALVRKAASDPRLTKEQREKAKARLADIAKLKAG